MPPQERGLFFLEKGFVYEARTDHHGIAVVVPGAGLVVVLLGG